MANQHKQSSAPTVTTAVATVYNVRIPGGFGWARAVIQEWPGGGAIDVQSDNGTFAHFWTHIGAILFRKFLIGLDFGYFMEKAATGPTRLFNPDRTVQGMKRRIIEARRENWLDSKSAREIYYELDRADPEFPADECEFVRVFVNDRILSAHFDCYDLPLVYDRHPMCAEFWNTIWPILCERWRAELEQPVSLEPVQ